MIARHNIARDRVKGASISVSVYHFEITFPPSHQPLKCFLLKSHLNISILPLLPPGPCLFPHFGAVLGLEQQSYGGMD